MAAVPDNSAPAARSVAAAEQLTRALRALLVALAVAYVAAFVFVALSRIAYPFELEWMEGGTLDHLVRVLDGQQIYDQPSIDFAAFLYPPLYYWVAALPAQVLGAGFAPLRLVSIIATLGSIVLIYVWVRRETGTSFSALLSSGLYAAAFRPSGGWFDIARVDSLLIFLLLAAAAAVRFSRSGRSFAVAGLVMTLAVMTKQVAVLLSVPLALYCIAAHGRRGVWFAIAHAVSVVGFVIFMQATTDGWFWFYAYEVPSRHSLLPDALVTFWTRDLFRAMPIACLLAIVALWRIHRRGFYVATVAGLLAAAWSGRLHEGTYVNNLLPAYAALAVLFGIGIDRASSTWKHPVLVVTVLALCVFQLGKLTYSPHKRIPTNADTAAGTDIICALRSIDGRVLVPSHGYLARLAGKASCIHTMAIEGFVTGGPSPVTERLVHDIRQAIAHREYAAILLDAEPAGPIAQIGESYRVRESWLTGTDAFWPTTGFRTRPRDLWVPLR